MALFCPYTPRRFSEQMPEGSSLLPDGNVVAYFNSHAPFGVLDVKGNCPHRTPASVNCHTPVYITVPREVLFHRSIQRLIAAPRLHPHKQALVFPIQILYEVAVR